MNPKLRQLLLMVHRGMARPHDGEHFTATLQACGRFVSALELHAALPVGLGAVERWVEGVSRPRTMGRRSVYRALFRLLVEGSP